MVRLLLARTASDPVSEKARILTNADRRSKAGLLQKHRLASWPGIHPLQRLPCTGSADAVPAIGIEEGAMGCTLDVVTVGSKKNTRHPIELRAAMWAPVQEQRGCVPPAHGNEAPSVLEIHPPARLGWHGIQVPAR